MPLAACLRACLSGEARLRPRGTRRLSAAARLLSCVAPADHRACGDSSTRDLRWQGSVRRSSLLSWTRAGATPNPRGVRWHPYLLVHAERRARALEQDRALSCCDCQRDIKQDHGQGPADREVGDCAASKSLHCDAYIPGHPIKASSPLPSDLLSCREPFLPANWPAISCDPSRQSGTSTCLPAGRR